MGLTEPQGNYVNKICTFNATQFDPRWIKYIQVDKFGQEALSRFGLGVAGYRIFAPFKYTVPKDNLSPELILAVASAKSVAEAAPTWAIHPITRDPKILTRLGNLNKNLTNLILEVFEKDQIDIMVKNKALYEYPTLRTAFTQYRTWAATDDISGNELVSMN